MQTTPPVTTTALTLPQTPATTTTTGPTQANTTGHDPPDSVPTQPTHTPPPSSSSSAQPSPPAGSVNDVSSNQASSTGGHSSSSGMSAAPRPSDDGESMVGGVRSGAKGDYVLKGPRVITTNLTVFESIHCISHSITACSTAQGRSAGSGRSCVVRCVTAADDGGRVLWCAVVVLWCCSEW